MLDNVFFNMLQVQSSGRPEQQPAEEEQQEDEDSDEVGRLASRCWTFALRRLLLRPCSWLTCCPHSQYKDDTSGSWDA